MIEKYIEVDKDIKFGEPRVINTRLSVLDVVLGIYFDDFQSYLDDHELSNETGIKVLEYCSAKECLRSGVIKFCDKCVFGRLQSGETFFNLTKEFDLIIVSENDQRKIIYSKNNNLDFSLNPKTYNYLGTEEEFLKEIEGYKGWEIAKSLLEKNT